MKFDFQMVATGLLLIAAVIYVFRTVRKSFKAEHDCPDCGVPVSKKSMAPKKKSAV